MNPANFNSSSSAQLVKTLDGDWAFVPRPLEPRLHLDWQLVSILSNADRKLSELAGLARTLPNPHLLIAPFARREAVLSSRIEGTQATYSDLLSFEVAGAERSDVREVSNYIRALEFGLQRLHDIPISLRLLKELHGILLEGVRGQQFTPGDFRRSQNHIGPPGCSIEDATYVPPPPQEMQSALNELETYIHAESDLPPLIRVALIHYQFEAIHPFLDGNGRIGRLLVTLLLCQWKLLPQPLLYLSGFIERHKSDYYRLLLSVSTQGAWEDWIRYILRGIATQADDGIRRSHEILALAQAQRDRLRAERASATLHHLADLIVSNPYVTAAYVAEQLDISFNAAQSNIQRLVEAGMLNEITGKSRNRAYVSEKMLAILEAPEPRQDVAAPGAQ